MSTTQVDCVLATGGADCLAVRTCLGNTIVQDPACVPGCADDHTIVRCSEGLRAEYDCETYVEDVGPNCVTGATRSDCGGTTCTVDGEHTCAGAVSSTCDSGNHRGRRLRAARSRVHAHEPPLLRRQDRDLCARNGDDLRRPGDRRVHRWGGAPHRLRAPRHRDDLRRRDARSRLRVRCGVCRRHADVRGHEPRGVRRGTPGDAGLHGARVRDVWWLRRPRCQ